MRENPAFTVYVCWRAGCTSQLDRVHSTRWRGEDSRGCHPLAAITLCMITMLQPCVPGSRAVCLLMDNKLFRANRTTKVSSTSLAAFSSPSFPPLATFGTFIQFAKVDRPIPVLPLRVHTCVVLRDRARCHAASCALSVPWLCALDVTAAIWKQTLRCGAWFLASLTTTY